MDSKICIKENCNEICFRNKDFCKQHLRECYKLYKKYKNICKNINTDGYKEFIPSQLENKDILKLKELLRHKIKEYNQLTRCIDAREIHHQTCYGKHSDEGHLIFLKDLYHKKDLYTNDLYKLNEIIKEKNEKLVINIDTNIPEVKKSYTISLKKKKKKKIKQVVVNEPQDIGNIDVNLKKLIIQLEEEIERKAFPYKKLIAYILYNSKDKNDIFLDNNISKYKTVDDYINFGIDTKEKYNFIKNIITNDDIDMKVYISLYNKTPDTVFMGENFTTNLKNVDENEVVRIFLEIEKNSNKVNTVIDEIVNYPCPFSTIYKINKKGKYINNNDPYNIYFDKYKMIVLFTSTPLMSKSLTSYVKSLTTIMMEKNLENINLIRKINKNLYNYKIYDSTSKKIIESKPNVIMYYSYERIKNNYIPLFEYHDDPLDIIKNDKVSNTLYLSIEFADFSDFDNKPKYLLKELIKEFGK
jgi:hypothetical protein